MKEEAEYTVVIEQDEEGWLVATVPSLPGCHTQGRTLEEVRERVREAIGAYVGSDAAPRSRFIALERVAV